MLIDKRMRMVITSIGRSASILFVLVGLLLSRRAAAEEPVYLNTALDVQYIGTAQCVTCHRDEHASYLNTSHSRSAGSTDPKLEPPAGQFTHRVSGHHYEVEYEGGKMLHREQRRGTDGQPLGEAAYHADITFGSGAHAKSYLCQIGPFHVESPITYFDDDKSWGISPGFDFAQHHSFRRAVAVGCVFCHVNTIKQLNHNPYKFEITEPAVGCERCHGPGQLHAQLHRNTVPLEDENKRQTSAVSYDNTIVNPAKLPRELSEAICQQCHCQGIKYSEVSGKNVWDYRPGLRLTDYRVDFQFTTTVGEAMSLVGHVEQLHESKCYTATDTLTCITCHDPHNPPDSANRLEYHRRRCLQCHNDQACGVDVQQRQTTNQDDCARCHMPRRDTDVAHFALRNHRIAVYDNEDWMASETTANIVPVLDIGHLSPSEQQRLKALAKYELFRGLGGDPKYAGLQMEATEELITLKRSGMSDVDVDAALAWLAWEQGQPQISKSLADDVVARSQDETMSKIMATSILAKFHLDQRSPEKAIPLYQSLEKYRREAIDSYYLGLALQNSKKSDDAILALKRSLEIDPSQVAAHAALQAILQSLGRREEAAFHESKAAENSLLQRGQAEK